ncbi:MAG: hypothetical protein FVQ79_04750 [Planctomycetes bacterium]|nr:hypothetical protein [Planctomycetota bacterium]
MKHVILAAFFAIILFQPLLIADSKTAPSIEIISTDPPCPAVLEPGQRFYVKLRYNAGDAESFRIWVRPKKPARGCKSHPCGSITKKTGEYEGWFYFNDRAITINGIVVKMKDNKSKENMLENTYPLKAEWKAPKGEGPQGYSVGNASLEVISTDPALPAILDSGQKLKIKMRYNADGAESCRIRTYAHRDKDGNYARGEKTSPCGSLEKKEGIFESYVFFDDRAVDLGMLLFRLYNPDTKRYLADHYYPIDAKWKAPQEKIVKQKEKPKPADPFAVIQAGIAKKYAKKYEGVWTHTITKPDGRKYPAIIKALRNKNGSLSFSFLHNPFTLAPVCKKHSIDQYRATIQFKLDDSEKGIMYSLARKNNSLAGNLYYSWKDAPEKVTLRKLTLAQAASALEKQYKKNAGLKRTRKSDLKNIAKLKKRVTKLKAKLKTSDAKKRKIETSFKRAKKAKKDQQNQYIIMTKKLKASILKLKEENKNLTGRLDKSEKTAESEKNKNKNLQTKLIGLEKQIAKMSETISDMNAFRRKLTNIVDETQNENAGLAGEISALNENIEKLKKLNRTLKRQKKQLQKELHESTNKQDQEKHEHGSRKRRKSSRTRQSQGYWVESAKK